MEFEEFLNGVIFFDEMPEMIYMDLKSFLCIINVLKNKTLFY
jgi:hypothetical protein